MSFVTPPPPKRGDMGAMDAWDVRPGTGWAHGGEPVRVGWSEMSYILDALKRAEQKLQSAAEREGLEPLTRVRTAAEVSTYPSGGTSMNDLQRLIEKYEKRIAELEAQIGALIRKRDILVEAARLLEEEGLTLHKTV